MMKIDRNCSDKLIGLLNDVLPIIPVEWIEISEKIKHQLRENLCDELLISLFLSFLKKQIREENDATLQYDCTKENKLREKTEEIINILSCVLIQPPPRIQNSIRR